MASFNPQTMSRGQFAQARVGIAPQQTAPAGTFMPGTKVQVGSHRVVIDRYLSEGGFAHVYVVTLPRPVDDQEKAVLKRVAVPDKEHLANMRTEVETMKRLRGHKHIVKYIDSHASPLKAGGFEVFLLMEFCHGGGLIDFMNTRLQNRLTEPEILKIFTDVAEGVACMHYLRPPLLHRDLKVENVLISFEGKSRIYKLCDFGSAAPPRPAATSAAEGRLIEEDVQRHTTMQYRSPEMIDVYRKQPIDEKSDVWALGVFLYKLCYYTTPFEEVGQMAILNASFKYPGYPKFSDQLKLLIASMLREHPAQRPNIYQVLQKSCQLDKREFKLRDIYSERTQSERRNNEVLPSSKSTPAVPGAMLSPPVQEPSASIPDIAPMRRGRPSRPVSQHNSARPSPSPLRMVDEPDPFSQLDGNKVAGGDELSHKFPTLDQFSLMTEDRSKFAFESKSSERKEIEQPLSERVTNALADEAFARSESPKVRPEVPPKSAPAKALAAQEQQSVKTNAPAKNEPPTINTRKPTMVSTGTMTSPPASTPAGPLTVSDRPIYRFPPSENASPAQTISSKNSAPSRPPIKSSKSGSLLAGLLKDDAARSQQGEERSTKSTRPSMDDSRPNLAEISDSPARARSLDMRVRPASVNMGSGPTHIKDQGIKRSVMQRRMDLANQDIGNNSDSDTTMTSEVSYLKAKEEEEKEKNRLVKRNSSGSRHSKRASLPSLAISGTKNLFSGRFGDAFKKFESQDPNNEDALRDDPADILTPIAGSEATDLSEDRHGLDETEELSPEMKRELEKRQLEAEERRVASAAAEYRSRTAGRPSAPPVSSKAASIQNRVQSLLQESGRPVQKTATGYGHFTETTSMPPPQVPQKSATFQTSNAPQSTQMPSQPNSDVRSLSAPAAAVPNPKVQRPSAPPKPRVLQTMRNGDMDQDSVPPSVPASDHDLAVSNEDWEAQFSKKYPSLSHLEMVETEIDTPKASAVRTREI